MAVRLRSIGDIVLLTPALRLLKEWRPDLKVSVVVESRFRELLENNPDIDQILSLGESAGFAKIAARRRAVREIRRRRFSLCVNLHGGPSSAFLTRWSGAASKVGFHHYRSPALYDVLVPDAKLMLGQSSVHTAELQAAAFFHLGLPRAPVPRARLLVTPEHQRWWSKQREALGIGADGEYAVVHPAALYPTKQWSAEKFGRLGAWLETEKGLPCVFCCGPGERAVLDAVAQSSPSPLHRLEDTSLGQFAAALAGARVFVGNDSGPAHMAAALERPTVVIFGSSSSAIWGPWPRAPWHAAEPRPAPDGTGPRPDTPATSEGESARLARVVQNFYDCNPCPGDRCYRFERPECILSIKMEQVQSAVEEVLSKSEIRNSKTETRV